MRIRSRTARRFDAFDRKFDAVVTPLLLERGFTETQPYVFTRPDADGHDFAYFDVEGRSFIVYLGYKPRYMEEIDQLYAPSLLPLQPHTGGCAFLTPKCMTHRPKEFPCLPAARRDHSLALVVEGFETHALGWLASLRTPVCYADEAAPTATMYVGRANEVAGRLDRARDAYEEQMRRELACWDLVTFNKFVEHEGSRTFVYLCLKLGREPEKCRRVMDSIKYYPSVEPLPIAL